MGSKRPLQLGTLVAASSSVAVFFAVVAVWSRESNSLPDVVGHHLQCPQCHSMTQKGLSQLADCPCKVTVGGVKDGQYYSGVITVTRTDKVVAAPAPPADEEAPEEAEPPAEGGCRTPPLHLRVTAKGTFVGGLQNERGLSGYVAQVFAGDPRTESMLQQLLHFFGPNPKNGLVLDGTLTCRQEWDLEHPDYLIPKPGYPSDVAVKIPYGSTLEPLDDDQKLSPFETEVPESLAQRYGNSPATARLRHGLESAMRSRLFQRDAAASRDAPPAGGSDGGRPSGRRRSMRGMLKALAAKVDRIADQTDRLDDTLGRVRRVTSWGPH